MVNEMPLNNYTKHPQDTAKGEAAEATEQKEGGDGGNGEETLAVGNAQEATEGDKEVSLDDALEAMCSSSGGEKRAIVNDIDKHIYENQL